MGAGRTKRGSDKAGIEPLDPAVPHEEVGHRAPRTVIGGGRTFDAVGTEDRTVNKVESMHATFRLFANVSLAKRNEQVEKLSAHRALSSSQPHAAYSTPRGP